ncbi:LysR family transcriptional regulator [Acinetobacter calcoaceticus]|uniref:LysR family transcriptional regulator n=1 Tax=Acinetobacter calcoaceticus TaxID=471 RepID=UPI003009708B
MELKQLKYFIAVIESGSLGKAAKNLDIGTSALSQQISKLESELSIRLLQRTALGTVPTPAGLAFFQQVQLALRHLDHAVDSAHSSRLSGHVTVGFSPSVAAVIGTHFLKLMRNRYPDIKVRLIEGLSGDLKALVNARQLDVAIIFSDDVDPQWAIQPLVKEQMFLISPKEVLSQYHLESCIDTQTITHPQLKELPLILPSQRHGLRLLLEQKIHQLKVAYEIDGLHLLMESISQLEMATIQPAGAALNSRQDLCLLRVVEPAIERINYLISLSEEEISPATLATKVVIRACVTNLINEKRWPSGKLINT